ncbi:MAG: type I restriction endonuclease [Bacteroidetes bacterium]|nr:MAG: type I restriction endonuclease [Bacteroidota bacterium]
MKFTESQLERVYIDLLQELGYPYLPGAEVERSSKEAVLIEADLKSFLQKEYQAEAISEAEISSLILQIKALPASDLYDSNRKFSDLLRDGQILKRDDRQKKDFYLHLINFEKPERNTFRFVNQLEIQGFEKRIPDGILYVNGLPLVVFEFKSAIREEATLHQAYEQLTLRYKRNIPELFKYNAFCVISDGVNSKAGSFFSNYEFYYAWRKISGHEAEVDGIDAMHSLIGGMLEPSRLLDIIQNFLYLPDRSTKEDKILCRYPQYYAARKLYQNILLHKRPDGDGKGGTYFGATGCGKSYTMLFLSRLLMKSTELASPTIVLITDRTDLDDQLSSQFTNAKKYIGDNSVISVNSRQELREKLKGRNSGGVFLTTIHKFNEDTELLSERTNIICISDEAHRSQVNLQQKVKVTEYGVKKSFGFAKHLHDSLPNATYVGFTGTPIDATMDVFGEIVDSYTMTESVKDDITVRIVYEGRAAKVMANNYELQKIENYYAAVAEEGANEYQIEESKKQVAGMNTILGDPDRIRTIAEDFVKHYEQRVNEGSTLKGKAMFVCSTRQIAFQLYQEIIRLKPEWAEKRTHAEGEELSAKDQRELMPIERIKMVMTRGKDDPDEMYEALGTKEYRKELDKQFKNAKSNFKIAIVVDMWLTGFDVPFLDTMYLDKPLQKHSLIQTISRVNRKFEGKQKGLVVDYFGIKRQMNLALAMYAQVESQNFEDIDKSITVVRDHLALLENIFYKKFDYSAYFKGSPLEQLHTLNKAAEFVQLTKNLEKRFMALVKRLKAAYDICAGSGELSASEKDHIHFYIAVRSIVFKLTKGEAPDIAQMNAKVREMIKAAIESDGVEEIFKLGEDGQKEIDLFDEQYLKKIDKIKLPNTKIKLLQKLLAQAIEDFKKINRAKGIDFTKKMQFLVDTYNERKEDDVLRSEVLEDFTDEIIQLYYALKKEKSSYEELGIDFEEKAFYDILKQIADKFDFNYPEDKMLALAKAVKDLVDDKTKFTDWNVRDDIKAELRAFLIVLLDEFGYPPISHDEAYKEIFEQAENFKKYSGG